MYARLTIATVTLLVSISEAGAQRRDDDFWGAVTIGEQFGQQAGAVLSSAVAMRQQSARATAEIQASRRRYWDALASGRDVETARADFAAKLWSKDLLYLAFSVPEGERGPMALVLNVVGGGVDGGIRPAARTEFRTWLNRVRMYLGASSRSMVMPSAAQLTAAMRNAQPEQALYLRARDWAEIEASGQTFPWQTKAPDHALMIVHRYGPIRTLEQARVS